MLLKEALNGAGAPDRLRAKLVAMGKEALTVSSPSGSLGVGDFTGWYFEVAWPVLLGQKNKKQKGGGAGGGGASGGGVDAAQGRGGGDVPAGWKAALGVHLGESRRFGAICAQLALPLGRNGRVPTDQVPMLIQQALQPVELEQTELDLIITSAAAVSASAVDRSAPPPAMAEDTGTVTVGVLTKFWFTTVWPTLSSQLLAAHHLPFAKQTVLVSVEYEDG